MPRRSRRKPRRPIATLPQREQQRLISYLPTEAASPTSEEAAESKIVPHTRAGSGAEPRQLTRDYGYVPAELSRIFLLTAAMAVIIIVLAVVLR
ncbi:MAG: hypothetical protein ACE5IZ_00865 [Dehalococcoidia bacterium]